jgi:hypothetical protein
MTADAGWPCARTAWAVSGCARSPRFAEYVAHYHRERNHQGLDNELIDGAPQIDGGTRICRRLRLGGLLNHYYLAA